MMVAIGVLASQLNFLQAGPIYWPRPLFISGLIVEGLVAPVRPKRESAVYYRCPTRHLISGRRAGNRFLIVQVQPALDHAIEYPNPVGD